MTAVSTNLFPFPHFNCDNVVPGAIQDWPDTCKRCPHRDCKKGKVGEIGNCSFGYNYIAVDADVVVAGILVRDVHFTSKARAKRIREEQPILITKSMLERSIETLRAQRQEAHESSEREKKERLESYFRTEQFKTDFLKTLQPDIQQGLSFVHDYKQINSQISQNINVVIESRYTGASFDDKLEKSTREEKAIYAASKFLEEKLAVTKFLLHPELLDQPTDCVKSRFHGLVLKYRRIYAPRFESKAIVVSMTGQSYAEIFAHPQAVAVIPHTLIDNAAKYSPRGGRAEIDTRDSEGAVDFSVSSFGPRILPDEQELIFRPFFRGKAAKQLEEEGAGYGLYISQLIAKRHLGTEIRVEQDSRQTPKMGHWTVFSVRIPLKSLVAIEKE